MELSILHAIQSFSNPFWDYLFSGITLAVPIATVFAVTLVYWLWDKEKGEYMAYSLLLSLNVNGIIKNIFNFARPIGEAGIRSLHVETATGSSFPSGHTQSAAVTVASWGACARRRAVWVAASIITLLVALSRLYTGVHWPKDVLAAMVLGGLCAAVAYYLFGITAEPGREVVFALTAVVFLPLVLIWPDADFVRGYGMLVGFAVAVPLEHRYARFSTDRSRRKRRQVLRELVGLILLGAVKFGLGSLLPEGLFFTGIEYAAVAFTAFFLCPLLFKRLQL